MAGQEVSIRRRLPRDLLWMLVLLLSAVWAYRGVATAGEYGVGWDAYAYYHSWPGGLYGAEPGRFGAYNYSPAFAQLIWPLTLLPWPLFCGVFIAAAGLGTWWLLRPARGLPTAALALVSLPDIVSGNLHWLLAVVAVLGLRTASLWCVPALTKVLPTLGPVWFLARGEWRPLVRFAAVLTLVVGVSYLAGPHLWHEWFDFLLRNSDGSEDASGVGWPPLWLRLPVALLLTLVAARTERAWLLPVALLLSAPVLGQGSLAVLAAIPRLHARGSG